MKEAGRTIAGRAALEARTASGSGPYQIKGKPVSYAGDSSKLGWYLDLPAHKEGERAAASPVVRAGAVLFDTLAPGLEPCGTPAVRSYAVDALSGMALGAAGAAEDGAVTGAIVQASESPTSVLPHPPLLLEVGVGSGPRTATGTAIATRTYAVIRPGRATQGAPPGQMKVAFAARRLSWRQVANWQDLHNKAKR